MTDEARKEIDRLLASIDQKLSQMPSKGDWMLMAFIFVTACLVGSVAFVVS